MTGNIMINFFNISETLRAGRYICMSTIVNIPPFFGSKKECIEACKKANIQANKEFEKFPISERNRILNLLNK
jgi:hypothetical protein